MAWQCCLLVQMPVGLTSFGTVAPCSLCHAQAFAFGLNGDREACVLCVPALQSVLKGRGWCPCKFVFFSRHTGLLCVLQ